MSLAAPLLLACVLSISCSSGDSGGTSGSSSGGETPCNVDPWICPNGQTCMSVDETGTAFHCVTSGAGKVGDKCQNVLIPECGDDLTCFAVKGFPQQVCTPFCDPTDPAHACPDNGPCLTVQTQGGQTLHECQPPEGGGGAGGGSGGASSSSAGGGGAGGGAGGAGGAGGG